MCLRCSQRGIMNQEYKIVEFRIDLDNQNRSVFLPVGAQILEVYYEVRSIDYSWIAQIGSIDKLQAFNRIKRLRARGYTEMEIVEILNNHRLAHIPLKCLDGDVRLVINALVPALKPKGKYA